MKATEIQIGDWVTILKSRENGSDRNVCINGIAIDCIIASGMFQRETGCDIFDYDLYNYGQLAPIPLTPEILEINGFIKVNGQRYDLGDYDTDCYVKVNPKKRMMHINGVKSNINMYNIPYVHQLQHALRLCGLDEIADNFKL